MLRSPPAHGRWASSPLSEETNYHRESNMRFSATYPAARAASASSDSNSNSGRKRKKGKKKKNRGRRRNSNT